MRRFGGRLTGGRYRTGRRGFLLMDAMLALSVATLAILSATSLIVTSAAAADAAKQNTAAYNAARQVIENLRQQRGATLNPGRNLDAAAFGPLPQLQQLTGGSARLDIYEYQERDPATGAFVSRDRVRAVSVTVTWRSGDRGGKPRSRTVGTLIGPAGIAP